MLCHATQRAAWSYPGEARPAPNQRPAAARVAGRTRAMTVLVKDLHHNQSARAALLRLNNDSARETSALTADRFDR